MLGQSKSRRQTTPNTTNDRKIPRPIFQQGSILRQMERADGHRYYEGLAVAHVLGGLDDTEGQVFRSHLLECVDCRARVGELRAIAHDLADVERDERRMRAAQAIDTKRREGDDGGEESDETPDVTRASRITVIVGMVLVIGLSLWNFTLRGE